MPAFNPFLGQVSLFAGNFAPRGWAFCSGQLLSIASNSALFSLLGTTYGGDGRVTFALPDLRGRTPRGSANGSAGPGLPAVQNGARGGAVSTTLNATHIPTHSHTQTVSSSDASTGDAGVVAQAEDIFRPTNDAGTLVDSAPTKNNTGGQAMNILNPYTGLNYIIATQGTFPSRS